MRVQVVLCSLLLAVILLGSTGPAAAKQAEDKYEPLKRFSQVLDMVERYYVRDVTRKELVEGAVRGMLQELDPHSSYMDKEEFEEMQVSTSGEFSGYRHRDQHAQRTTRGCLSHRGYPGLCCRFEERRHHHRNR